MSRKQFIKVTSFVMSFGYGNTKMCVCRIENGIGYDAFNDEYSVITDDFGNLNFVSYVYK